jgi:tRNA-dihydrouridine synthase 2
MRADDLSARYRDGVMLAPMVRSGACMPLANWLSSVYSSHLVPTRLVALQYGAKLVWGPEIIDKAILHAVRNVDRMFIQLPFASGKLKNLR